MTHALRLPRRLATLLTALTIFAPALAHAGGPLELCSTGVPYRWANGGIDIPWNPDQGTLGPLTNAQGVEAVASAFTKWGEIPSASTTYLQAAPLPVNVNVTNFFPYLAPSAPDGLSAIVFDEDGAIFTLLFGADSGVLGFAGPEWLDPSTCTIAEGLSFLNGPEFTNMGVALDIMVHEFGHYQNMAHTVVNGQVVLGDSTGPWPFNTFPVTSLVNLIETMYPFYFGPAAGTSTPHKDDIATLSTLYPSATFAASTGSIRGRILSASGRTPKTGFNVIARNIANPFADAVSAISSDFTRDYDPDAPLVGVYTLRGLTPGARYAVFVDYILEGGFSTPPAVVQVGPEEFYSGSSERRRADVDPPNEFAPVTAVAGITRSNVNIIFNGFEAGAPLPVDDEEAVEVELPFAFRMCGTRFNEVIVNANGTLSFGRANRDASDSVAEFLAGPPQIAGAWDDLNAGAGGSVTFSESPMHFTVNFTAVPEFANPPANGTGSNTFSITLRKLFSQIEVSYGALSMVDGLAGVSCGGAITSGFEMPTDLSARADDRINLLFQPAVFERFAAASPNDLSGLTLRYTPTTGYSDFRTENNDTLRRAHRIELPFSSVSVANFTEIGDPDDVDFYRFTARAGDVVTAEILSSQLDTVIGLFNRATGEILAADDDGGVGRLSKVVFTVPADGEYAIAVSTFPDEEFDGGGEGSGRYVLSVTSAPSTVASAGVAPEMSDARLGRHSRHVPAAER
jgi:hypothetical protein